MDDKVNRNKIHNFLGTKTSNTHSEVLIQNVQRKSPVHSELFK